MPISNNFDLSDPVSPRRLRIGAASFISGALAFAAAYMVEQPKMGQIPVAFSEIGQLWKCVNYYPNMQNSDYCGKIGLVNGTIKKIPVLTEFYASVNDMNMMVFKANNIARTEWRDSNKFAYELEKEIDPADKIHTQMPYYAERIPQLAVEARAKFAPMFKARADIEPAIRDLENTWSESHHDVEKAVTKYRTVCDSNGNNCKEESYTDYEYDYTHHTYTFYPQNGQSAASNLQSFLTNNPNITIHEELIRTWATNADNEMLMRDSRRRLPWYEAPTEDDYLNWANMWATGSNYMTHRQNIYTRYTELSQSPAKLQAALNDANTTSYANFFSTARTISYNTSSHYDSGPRSFRTTQKILTSASSMHNLIARVENGINYAETAAPELGTLAKKYVDAHLHHIGEEGDLKGQVLRAAQKLYASNFDGGFDVSGANWGLVTLATLASAAIGGLGMRWREDGGRMSDFKGVMPMRRRYRNNNFG